MRTLFLLVGALLTPFLSFSQSLNMDLNAMDVVIHDTLISKSDFIANVNTLPASRAKYLVFAPPTDGLRTIYYLSGGRYAQGVLQSGKETGEWTYWHRNGQKARVGPYVNGQREGTHSYWYENGNLRGVGGFQHDEYEGTWTMYAEDGKPQSVQTFRNGKSIK
ncbi:toxin-antitoxin system YwqK family antitoxin [Hymenobacter canadensis]|uniref:Toxin-antitoxin system YwqK family antitoxin n=1 Tax=Hymenobacter canadensis TaxID=2999067 RepID=A0ABY7LU88_9BACT|nr:hypothetical protein [Hymenobacter canadensis]WBA43968.1 hypothetical protein O3303_20600 [Hymenobacter canadensis]